MHSFLGPSCQLVSQWFLRKLPLLCLPWLIGNSSCERNNSTLMLTGVTSDGAGVCLLSIPAGFRLLWGGTGVLCAAFCLPFLLWEGVSSLGAGRQDWAASLPTRLAPALSCHLPIQTQCCCRAAAPSPLQSSSAHALCSEQEPACLFLSPPHRPPPKKNPFPPGRERQTSCQSLIATTAVSAIAIWESQGYISPAHGTSQAFGSETANWWPMGWIQMVKYFAWS